MWPVFAFQFLLGSQNIVVRTRRPNGEQEPRSQPRDRGFAFVVWYGGHARPGRSGPHPRPRDAEIPQARSAAPIALSGAFWGGDRGERGRRPFNSNRDLVNPILTTQDRKPRELHDCRPCRRYKGAYAAALASMRAAIWSGSMRWARRRRSRSSRCSMVGSVVT